ncbi:hypothetical protein AVEN_35369-1 [Araneus ventricosus]|uniref:Uncharacterized protein n=1 Tax=Araneus ventricosus TaxID=182803 RepID=A0A4Y2LXM4_ARAVE|nr:hypothetical protein AVEN_35369-1 [Araneus ventricosus]
MNGLCFMTPARRFSAHGEFSPCSDYFISICLMFYVSGLVGVLGNRADSEILSENEGARTDTIYEFLIVNDIREKFRNFHSLGFNNRQHNSGYSRLA